MATQPVDPAQELWSRLAPADREAIANYASQIPVPIGEIGRHFGLRIRSVTLPSDISGLIKLGDDGVYEIQVNNTDAPVRQRFTVAHEIAHYLLHREFIGLEGIEDSILYRSRLSNRQEAEANRLAAAILLPWSAVREWHLANYECEPERNNLDSLAAAFRTSSLAAGFRLNL
jgi:hypothetical protein